MTRTAETGPFAHLPAAVRQLLPEIDTLDWPGEPRADCERCPQIDGRFGPWSFSPETRCCTAQPSLANFLAGRALRRGGTGRDLLLARLEDLRGVSPWGVDPPPEIEARYEETSARVFGRDTGLRCPYYVGGDLTCGIWHDRASTCRTWFCKHDEGLAGAVAWSRMHHVLFDVESRLAVWAIGQGSPPDDGAAPAAWARWFEETAAIVDAAPAEEIAALATGGLGRARGELRDFVEVRRLRRGRALPELLVPAVTELVRDGGDVLLTGYSSFDAVRAPAAVFALLSRLDGTRRWRDALAEVGAPGIDEALVRELHRVCALRDPAGGDDLPYEVELPDRDAWSRAAKEPP